MDNQNKMTMEELGASVRYKYPQYASLSNFDVAQKVIQKYPQYSNNVTDLPTKEGFLNSLVTSAEKKAQDTYGKDSLIYKATAPARFASRVVAGVGDFISPSTQKLGESAGQAFASGDVISKLTDAEKTNQDTAFRTQQLIEQRKLQGKDTTNLERFLSNLQGRGSLQEQISRAIPVIDKSNTQIAGEALGTGVEALSGGAFKGIKGFGLASEIAPTIEQSLISKAEFLAKPLSQRLKQIGIETAKNGAVFLPFGYATDIANNLQQDKSGASLFMPGFATTLSAVIPLGIGGLKAGREIAGETLKAIIPNFSGIPSGAYNRLKNGNVQTYLGNVTPESVLNDARASANAFKTTMMDEFGAGKEKIINAFTGSRIGLPETESNMLQKIADRFGFSERIPQNMQNMSAKETMDLLSEINNIPAIKEIDDPLVKNLKLNLKDIKDSIMSRAGATFSTAREGQVGEFQKLYDTYSTRKKVIKDIQSIIGKVGNFNLEPTKQVTAINRLQKVFNENTDAYINAIKALGNDVGENLLDKISASRLSPIAPKTLLGAPTGIRGIANDIFALLTFPLSSPRSSAYILNKLAGYDTSIATKLLNASPTIRTAIYDAVNKENMSFNDAVKLYAKDIVENIKNTPNKQGGFIKTATPYQETGNLTTKILKDLEGKTTVSKQYILDATNRPELKQVERDLIRQVLDEMDDTSPALKPLLQEARKYKSAEEFVKAQGTPIYRGEGGSNIAQGKALLAEGKHFASDNEYPKGFGTVSEYVIKPNAKVLDLGDSTFAEVSKKLGIPERRYISPKELSALAKEKGYDVLKYNGEYKSTGKQFTHFVDLTGDSTITKSQLTDIWNKAQKGSDIPVADFANKVKAELLPLRVKTTSNPKGSDAKYFREQTRGDAQYAGARMQPRYEMVNLPDELRGNVKNYRENIYESPIKTSAGDVHFGGKTDNYFGHTRIEDMADNKTRRVIEVQSDLYQKGRLEKESPASLRKTLEKNNEELNSKPRTDEYGFEYGSAPDADRIKFLKEHNKEIEAQLKDVGRLEQYNDPTAHFRMIREEIKKAAEDGKTKLQFPTGETAMKIEGLGQTDSWLTQVKNSNGIMQGKKITPDDLKVGMEIAQQGHSSNWIITDVLGDGKFKAVPKSTADMYKFENGKFVGDVFDNTGKKSVGELPEHNKETFDISGKVDTNNPIYKFYEKDMGKYLKSKYNAVPITDNNGVTWYQVDIKPEYKDQPVLAFGKTKVGLLPKLAAGQTALLGGIYGASKLKNNQNKKKEETPSKKGLLINP